MRQPSFPNLSFKSDHPPGAKNLPLEPPRPEASKVSAFLIELSIGSGHPAGSLKSGPGAAQAGSLQNERFFNEAFNRKWAAARIHDFGPGTANLAK